jgi:hypothetical protein
VPFLRRDWENEFVWDLLMSMMAPAQLEGEVIGEGFSLFGFHHSILEFPKKLQELCQKKQIQKFSQIEENGYVTFLGLSETEPRFFSKDIKCACYRREPHKFFIELPAFIHRYMIGRIVDFKLSTSHGSITLTILFHQAIPS